MLLRTLPILFLLWLPSLGPALACAQIPTGFPGSEPDLYNFGPLGASGVALSDDEAKDRKLKGKETGLVVKEVLESGPAAQAGLREGDVILATSFGKLTGKSAHPAEDAILQLTQAIDALEGKKRGKLQLIVDRGGRPEKLDIAVDSLGKHSRSCPTKCKKCDALQAQSLQALAEMQTADGSFPMRIGGSGGQVVVTSLAGLAFLASGSTPQKGPFRENIQKAAKFVTRAVGQASPFGGLGGGGGANWNQVNWELAYAPWFLCEVYRHRPTKALRDKLQELARRLTENMEESGGWAHGPGGPNALGYLELEIMSNYALTSLGVLRSVKIDVDEDVFAKALGYIEKCTTGGGGVCYSPNPGQFPGTAEAGRTAGAYFALARAGLYDQPVHAKMRKYVLQKSNLESMPHGHVSPVMHFLAGAFACREMGDKEWGTYWDTFRDTWRSYRQPDGIYTAVPTAESEALRSNSDRGNGPAWITASYCLIGGLHRGNLPVLLPEKKRGRPVEVDVPEIREAVETGDDEKPGDDEPKDDESGDDEPGDDER